MIKGPNMKWAWCCVHISVFLEKYIRKIMIYMMKDVTFNGFDVVIIIKLFYNERGHISMDLILCSSKKCYPRLNNVTYQWVWCYEANYCLVHCENSSCNGFDVVFIIQTPLKWNMPQTRSECYSLFCLKEMQEKAMLLG